MESGTRGEEAENTYGVAADTVPGKHVVTCIECPPNATLWATELAIVDTNRREEVSRHVRINPKNSPLYHVQRISRYVVLFNLLTVT